MEILNKLEQDYESLKQTVIVQKYKLDLISKRRKQLDDLRNEKKAVEAELETLKQVISFFGTLLDDLRQRGYDEITKVVNEALKAVFSSTDTLKLVPTYFGQNLDVSLYLVTENNFLVDLKSGTGGGIKDLVSTVLRLLLLVAFYPPLPRFVFLDEVGKNISSDFQERFGMFLNQLSKKLNLQVLLITHQQSVAQYADNIYQVTHKDGKSHVIKIK